MQRLPSLVKLAHAGQGLHVSHAPNGLQEVYKAKGLMLCVILHNSAQAVAASRTHEGLQKAQNVDRVSA